MEISFREHVRKRSGMYFGSRNRAQHAMIEFAIDDLLSLPDTSVSHVRIELAETQYALEFIGEVPGVSHEGFACANVPSNQALLGLPVMNAVCEWLEFEKVANGQRVVARFRDSILEAVPLKATSSADSQLRITYRPDRTLFPSGKRANFYAVCGRIQQYAVCHPAIRFTVEANEVRRDYQYLDGLLSYAQEVESERFQHGWSVPWIHCRRQESDEWAELVLVPNGTGEDWNMRSC